MPRRNDRERSHFRREHSGGMASTRLEKIAADCERDTAARDQRRAAAAESIRHVIIEDDPVRTDPSHREDDQEDHQ